MQQVATHRLIITDGVVFVDDVVNVVCVVVLVWLEVVFSKRQLPCLESKE